MVWRVKGEGGRRHLDKVMLSLSKEHHTAQLREALVGPVACVPSHLMDRCSAQTGSFWEGLERERVTPAACLQDPMRTTFAGGQSSVCAAYTGTPFSAHLQQLLLLLPELQNEGDQAQQAAWRGRQWLGLGIRGTLFPLPFLFFASQPREWSLTRSGRVTAKESDLHLEILGVLSRLILTKSTNPDPGRQGHRLERKVALLQQRRHFPQLPRGSTTGEPASLSHMLSFIPRQTLGRRTSWRSLPRKDSLIYSRTSVWRQEAADRKMPESL